jgi:hypothetical protein
MKTLEILRKFLEDFEATIELDCPACGGILGQDDDGNDTDIEHEDNCSWVALQEALPQIYKALKSI